jgi:hemoglobin-like flavoprotein
VFRWAWDLFNNDPDLLADDEATEQADQMQQTQMAMGMAQPAVDMMNKGSSAVKNIAQAHAQDGMDIGALLQTAQETLSKDPKAQQQIQDMMRGQAPELAS